jgi:hypothetical protein
MDRILRGIVGIVLLALPFLGGMALFNSALATTISVVLGLVMLGTAATRYCPIYSILGIRTCKV